MTLLTELIEAAEQAARDEVIAVVSKESSSFFAEQVVRGILPSTSSALERVIKAAVAEVKDAAQADAIRRFGQSTELLAEKAEDYQIQAVIAVHEKLRLQTKLKEAREIITALRDASYIDCPAYGRATKFLEAA